MTLKARPQLIRKRTVVKVQPNVQVAIKPAAGRAINLQEHNSRRIQITLQQPKQIQQIPANASVSKQQVLKRQKKKSPTISYVSRDVTPDSIPKIKQLFNRGKNKILVIIGNGPSITEIPLENLKNVPNIDTLSINKPDARVWPTTAWAFFDTSQLRRHEDHWNSYSGIIINSTSIKRQKENSLQVKNIGGKGFSRDLVKGLHIGRSSVFAAMQVGYWMNYEHVYLVGVDMNPNGINGKLHFYGVNPDVEPDTRKERFKNEAEYYDYAASILKEDERRKFTFCSSENPWKFVEQFNRMDHKVAIPLILNHAQQLVAV